MINYGCESSSAYEEVYRFLTSDLDARFPKEIRLDSFHWEPIENSVENRVSYQVIQVICKRTLKSYTGCLIEIHFSIQTPLEIQSTLFPNF